MKLLWCSNYTSQSGYSIQTRMFVPRLKALGHEVVVMEIANGNQRLPQQHGDVQVLPTILDPLGADAVLDHAVRHQIQSTITLVDVWGLNADVYGQLQWFPITPVDHRPVPPQIQDKLKKSQRPIAYTRFGETELRRAGFDPLYMPHAVDPAIWYPRDKAEARRKLGIPQNQFFAAFVGVNDSVPSRKGIPELLMAWQVFSEQHNNCTLYLHTAINGNLAINSVGGVNIQRLMGTFGIDPATVQHVDQYRYRTGIPASELAMIAAASDVLVLPTRGEGFGLPLLEFARVGTPSITTDTGGGAELCFAGWRIGYEPSWSWQNAVYAKPGVASLIEALDAAYQDRDNPERRKRSIEGARAYDIDYVIAQHALPTLEAIAEHALMAVS